MTTRSSPRSMTRVARRLLFGGCVALIACTDTSTSPERPALAVTQAAPAATTIAGSAAAVVAVQDAIDRSLVTFDADATLGLRAALQAVVDALLRSDKSAATAALDRADRVLDAFVRVPGQAAGADADLDAVRLALASASRASATMSP